MTLALGSPVTAAGRSVDRYDAVFGGDATGRTDVTAALTSFLRSHNGQRVALKRDGVYRVTQVLFTAHDLTVDFRGARIKGTERGVHGILRLIDARRVVLNDPRVHGTGYEWGDDDQFEHGIHIDGGRDITLRRPVTRDTRGDGIYMGYRPGVTRPATRVRILRPDIRRASRNGIAPVAGEVTIKGGRIDRVGLHGVDFEPSSEEAARSIRGIVENIDIRRVGDIPNRFSHYAVAAGGHSERRSERQIKKHLRITGVTGDCLRMTVRYTSQVVVKDNASDMMAGVSFEGSDAIAFRNNVNILGSMDSVPPCPTGNLLPGPSITPDVIPGPDASLMAHTIVRWAVGMMNDQIARRRIAGGS